MLLADINPIFHAPSPHDHSILPLPASSWQPPKPPSSRACFSQALCILRTSLRRGASKESLSTEDRGRALHKMRLTAEHFIYRRSLPCPLTSLIAPWQVLKGLWADCQHAALQQCLEKWRGLALPAPMPWPGRLTQVLCSRSTSRCPTFPKGFLRAVG